MEEAIDDGEENSEDMIFITVLGEDFYNAFETEIDSATSVLDEMDTPFWTAMNYDMEIRMPGRIIDSNGYAVTDQESENGGGILWTVKGDYFLTETYEMWAESKINNYFFWSITGFFIIFVFFGSANSLI